MDSLKPIMNRVFHGPEIWLILQTLGSVASNLEVPSEIASDENAVLLARTTLLQQGVLLLDPKGETQLASEIEALVYPSAYPEIVFVANIADHARHGKFTRVICFSWTPEAMVVNWVDEANDHHFESYAPENTKAAILAHLSRLCDLDVDALESAPVKPNAREIERLMAQMKQMVLLMAVSGVQTAEQTPRAMGWFVSGRHAWLMQNGPSDKEPSLSIANREDIVQAVSEFVEQTLPH